MNRIVRLSALALAMSSVSSLAPGAAFTPGNLAVARVGTGSGALSAAATAVFIDEYTTSGTLVQSIPLPTADSGANQTLTVAGSSTSEGMLTRSTDDRYLVLTGYDAAPGTASVAGTTAAATNRIIGRVDATGSVDTTTGLNSAFNTSNIRSAATADGSGIWAGGTGASGTGGIWYQTFGVIGAGTQVSTTVTNTRNLGIFANQLYTTAQSGAIRLAFIGSGLPTTTGQIMTNLPGLPTASNSPYGFVVLDRTPSVAGIDTLYFADDAAGLQKYSTGDGINWIARGSVAGNLRGLTARVDSITGSVVLFGTSTATSANTLITLTDTAAFDANIVATPTVIATAGTNTVFRGVAYVPSVAATPELSIAAANVAEGNTGCGGGSTPLDFPVTATVAPLSTLTFNFATSDGSATAGSDYTGVMAGTGTINAGQTTGTATVQVSCDNRVEANENFTASLTAGAGYTISATNGSATGTIGNDEVVAARISDVTQAEGTGGGTTAFNFTVSLDNGVEAGLGGISMLYTVDAAGATPGTDGVDFLSPAPEPGLFTIPDGSNSATLTVQVGADSTDEPNDTFAVTLSNIVAGSIVDATGDGTITNDDSAVPVISINDVSVTENDAGGPAVNAVFTVSIVPAPTGTVTVTADTASDSAVSPGDFTSTNAVLSFDNANTTRQFTVPITNDCTIEGSESFFVNLSGLTGTAAIGDSQGVGTITDNDVAINASISFLTPSANEGDTGTNTRVARVTLDRAMQCGDFTYSVNSTGGTATSGTDYQAVAVSNQTISGAATTADVNVTINGDLDSESDETVTLTLTGGGTNVTITPNTATATLVNDDTAPVMTIAEIQGDGSATTVPAAPNNVVTTFGNVVTTVAPTGFYMQMAVGDANMDTSDAIFVFTGAGSPSLTNLAAGDVVTVRGPVVEFNGITEFTTGSGMPIVAETGTAALPAAFVLDNAIPSPNNLVPFCDADNDNNTGGASGQFQTTDTFLTRNYECLEFMRVTTSTGVVNGPNQTFGTDPYAEMYMTTSGARSFREPGHSVLVNNENVAAVNLTPPAPVLPTSPIWDANPEIFELDVDKFFTTTTKNVLPPRTTFSATGLLGFEFGGYEFWVTANSGNTEADLTVQTPGPELPIPVPTAAPTQLTVGSLNVLRLYDYCDDPGSSSGNEPVNVAETDRKLLKLSAYIRNVLKSPDVIGIQEVELPSVTCTTGDPTSALQLLANKIAADGGPSYAAINSPSTNDIGRISVAFLVNTARVSVTTTTQLRATEQWTFTANGTPTTALLHDRPPFLLRAQTTVGNGGVFDFAVMTNHLRSLGGIDTINTVTNQENAHRIRRKKLAQSVAVACEAQTFQTANPLVPLVLIGDYNAFEFSDGYTDVNGIIRGDTDPAKSEYDIGFDGMTGGCTPFPNGQIVSPALTEALFSLPATERYSYVFGGNPQELDHAFLSTGAQSRFIAFAYGRGNADAPAREETQPLITVPVEKVLFASDHDGFVMRLDPSANRAPLVASPIANQSGVVGNSVTLNVLSSFSDPDNDTLTCTAQSLPNGLSINSSCVISGTLAAGSDMGSPYTVTVRATDTSGLFVETTFTFTVLPVAVFADGFE
ncbi:Calx-beta domain-containing protein [Ahniella affigens]|nr:Calx-beta domain-containing protein [Ahniella affigens]